MPDLERYLLSCPELSACCNQHGWIDRTSLYYEIIEQNDQEIIALVQFNEILMEEPGATASRLPCQARIKLSLDRYGQIIHAEIL